MDTEKLISSLRELTPGQIRERLLELSQEEKALRVLLRASIQIERSKQKLEAARA